MCGHFSYDKYRRMYVDIRSANLKGDALIGIPINWEEMDVEYGKHSFWFEVEFIDGGKRCIFGICRVTINNHGIPVKWYHTIDADIFSDAINGIQKVVDFYKVDLPYEFRKETTESSDGSYERI